MSEKLKLQQTYLKIAPRFIINNTMCKICATEGKKKSGFADLIYCDQCDLCVDHHSDSQQMCPIHKKCEKCDPNCCANDDQLSSEMSIFLSKNGDAVECWMCNSSNIIEHPLKDSHRKVYQDYTFYCTKCKDGLLSCHDCGSTHSDWYWILQDIWDDWHICQECGNTPLCQNCYYDNHYNKNHDFENRMF